MLKCGNECVTALIISLESGSRQMEMMCITFSRWFCVGLAILLIFKNRYRPGPACTGIFNFDRKHSHLKSVIDQDLIKIGQFLNLAILLLTSDIMGGPQHSVSRVCFIILGLQGQRNIPSPAVSSHHFNSLINQPPGSVSGYSRMLHCISIFIDFFISISSNEHNIKWL